MIYNINCQKIKALMIMGISKYISKDEYNYEIL